MCAKKAGKNKLEGDRYPNRHKYDCNGMLPVIFNCLNESKPSQFCSSLSHTVFNCIANTKLRRLIEYMNTGGKHKDGKWHAAFKGITDIRTIHPNIWDSSNYASVAWLQPCTDGWKKTKGKYGSMLFDFTIASIFLAYCLYISGYPMDWRASIDSDMNRHFFEKPPATWIAACFLYHFQATAINSFRCTDFIFWQDLKKREYLSCGIYPSLSLINHSCNPSADYRFTTDGAAVLIATRNLKAGSEITIAYDVTYAESNTQNRKQVLKESFFFECMCEACVDDWNDNNPQELIKCAVCHFESGVTTPKCPMCRLDLPAEEGLRVVIDSQALIEEVKYREWTDELQKRFASLINKANSLLASPSNTVTLLKEALLEKVDEKVAMWIEEPWQFNFFTCMEPGKSLFSKEDRWHLLD
ncbi:unnamed protein product [Hymenolepis diminuta]|nr:unnamed protein product [Hymenolepis diminuta]